MPNAEFTLTIVFNPVTKDCKVTGPVGNAELCQLGLELAKRVLAQHAERQQIVVTSTMPKRPTLMKQ